MDHVSKTLYIPLFGKAFVSRAGIILHDPDAEAIWNAEGFPLRGKSASKWLAYYMGMRSAVFDRRLTEKLQEIPDAVVLHPGCGLDSRIRRVGNGDHRWYDLDFPTVAEQRKHYFPETEHYRILGCDLLEESWLRKIPGNVPCIVVMEGISMYLPPDELKKLFVRLKAHFSSVTILMDVYSVFAARASRFKNPINDVGVTRVYGIDDPESLAAGTGLSFLGSHDLTPEHLIAQLPAARQRLFRKLYAGKTSRNLYKLWEFGTGT